MYEIFQKLLDENGLRAYDVAKATGISSSTLTDWKTGRSTPKQDKLKKIANYFNVSVDYLMNGENSKLNGFSEQAGLLVKIRNDKMLLNAIEKYYALSDKKKKHVLELIDLLREGV